MRLLACRVLTLLCCAVVVSLGVLWARSSSMVETLIVPVRNGWTATLVSMRGGLYGELHIHGVVGDWDVLSWRIAQDDGGRPAWDYEIEHHIRWGFAAQISSYVAADDMEIEVLRRLEVSDPLKANRLKGPSYLYRLLLPYWFLICLFGAWPLCLLGRRIRDGRRAGTCHRCGYDLRATPDRCPECGTEVNKPPPDAPPAPAVRDQQ